MLKNTVGLRKSALCRSQTTMEKAQLAIRRMQAKEALINFRSVAARAGVSTAWLYKTKALRDRIMRLRGVLKTPVDSETNGRRIISQERVIATLRSRIKQLEVRNGELKEQLERAYGLLAIRPLSSHDMKRKTAHNRGM